MPDGSKIKSAGRCSGGGGIGCIFHRMSRVLIKELHLWSIARTVFPLAWIVSVIVIFAGLLLVESFVTALLGAFTESPTELPATGPVAGLLISIVLGFFFTLATTAVALVTAVVYNFLVALGGGISITLSDLGPDLEDEGSPGDGEEA